MATKHHQAILVTLPIELHQQLVALSKKERRSMNQEAILAIERHVNKEKVT